MHDKINNESGFTLVAVTFVVLVMGGLASTLLIEMHGAKKAVDHQETSLLALQLVELGVARAELEISSLKDPDGDGIGTISGAIRAQPYEVSATPHPTVVNRWALNAQASHALSRRRVEVGIRRRGGGAFMEGLYAKEALSLTGVQTTDSYNSRLGNYASQAVNNDVAGTYANARGHIGSGMDIVAEGSSVTIRGNAIPGQDSEVLENGTPTILGDTFPRTEDVVLPNTPLSEFLDALNNNNNGVLLPGGGSSGGNGGDAGAGGMAHGADRAYDRQNMSLSLNGNTTVTLPAGTYFFTDVRVTGQAQIRVTGPVKIYMTGEFDLGGGGLVNASGAPADVRIFAHPYALPTSNPPSRTSVALHGGSIFAGTVYAPEADVAMQGGTAYFGAVVGRTMTIGGNFEFHYDEALGDLGGSNKVILERLYWREISPPRR